MRIHRHTLAGGTWCSVAALRTTSPFGRHRTGTTSWFGTRPANGGDAGRSTSASIASRGIAPAVDPLVTAARRVGTSCCAHARALGIIATGRQGGHVSGANEINDHEACRAMARLARKGDPTAVEWLIDRLVLVSALVKTKNARSGSRLTPEEVSDVVQESLVAIWAKLETFEGRSSFDTWICGFGVNHYRKAVERKHGARRYAEPEALEEHESRDVPPEEPLVEPQVVQEALDRLGPPASDVIRMRHFDDLSFDEISRRTGATENTIKTRYYRGLVRLKELLGAHWRKNLT